MNAVPFTCADALPHTAPRPIVALLDRVAGLSALQQLYESEATWRHAAFPDRALAALDVVVAEEGGIERLPATGPVVVVANHPRGALDGLAVASLVARRRADVKMLGNSLLERIPEMAPHLIPVPVFEPHVSRRASGLRAALAWLRDGHVLVVFPAGEVSHIAADGRLVDGAWHDGAAWLAARAAAPVVPVFIDGRNSRLFEFSGRVSPRLRTALLPREVLRQRGSRITLHVGHAVSARRLGAIGDAAARTAYLRVRTYGLAHESAAPGAQRRGRPDAALQPVAPPADSSEVAREIEALPHAALLVEEGPWRVYLVTAAEAPATLQEIGRLRELTFRAAGEGTGRARDLDRFDWHYRHLFVWHGATRDIVGAYRIAATDDVAGRGIGGLYTRTLFRYPAALLRELGPALELGRSFVRPEYQRNFQPLLLLWRGIGAVVAGAPRYRRLFGPVSISADYRSTTRALIARLLLARRPSLLRRLVAPRRPLPDGPVDTDALIHSQAVGGLRDVDELVRDLEAGERGLPVLLRHYLKLNATLLGFSVDPAFGGVLDGLVVVDLLDVDRTLLTRYFGREAAGAFLAAQRTPHRLPALVDAVA